LKLEYHKPLSTFGFNFNLCRYTVATAAAADATAANTVQTLQSVDAVPGNAVQVDPMKPTLKAPGTERLKLKYDEPISNSAFKFNLRRYNPGTPMHWLQPLNAPSLSRTPSVPRAPPPPLRMKRTPPPPLPPSR